ncbi:MAG TPA: hypothetical protein VFP84_29150, partial [Kofleriaceae bacterium]|nr:hypothetical protein [Kofleriaceae bacterium]
EKLDPPRARWIAGAPISRASAAIRGPPRDQRAAADAARRAEIRRDTRAALDAITADGPDLGAGIRAAIADLRKKPSS